MSAQSNTTLCIDFGNTRQKAAFFNEGQLEEVIFFDELFPSLERTIERLKPDRSILSSVILHSQEIEELLQKHTNFHLLNSESKLPFTITGKRETIGSDRLALCAAAVLLYPHQNNLVIGLGTAVTYNFINTANQFLGGGISPGLHMRAKSLNDYTAKLPMIDADWNIPLTGYDTKTNIQSGVVLGLAKELDGFIEAYRQKYRAFNVLLTGGDIAHLAPHLKTLIFADPVLLFKGLYAISEINFTR